MQSIGLSQTAFSAPFNVSAASLTIPTHAKKPCSLSFGRNPSDAASDTSYAGVAVPEHGRELSSPGFWQTAAPAPALARRTEPKRSGPPGLSVGASCAPPLPSASPGHLATEGPTWTFSTTLDVMSCASLGWSRMLHMQRSSSSPGQQGHVDLFRTR